MASTRYVNGQPYPIPDQGDNYIWGVGVSNWIAAMSNSTLQKNGGPFTLTNDVDFGPNNGLKSLFFADRGAAADSGAVRLSNTSAIKWRNVANNGNNTLSLTNDVLTYSGAVSATSFSGNGSALTGLDKSMVGLGNVDNTSDANKPISTATQAALDLKAPLASPTFTGVPAAPTAAVGTNTTQVATAALVKATGDTKLALTGGTVTGAITSPAFISSDPYGSAGGGLGFTGYAISGSTRFNLVWQANTGYPTALYAIHNPGTNAYVTLRFNGADTFVFYNNGAAAKPGGGAWADTSDARTKEDIQDWTIGLDTVMGLRVRQWRFKAETGRDPNIVYRGLVAQEAELCAPTLVRKMKGAIGSFEFDDMRQLDASDLPYILVNALQETARKLEAAMERIESLEASLSEK